MGDIYYKDGNCDGLRLDVNEGEEVPERVTCAGTNYDVVQISADQWLAILPAAHHPEGYTGPRTFRPVPLDKGVAEAWSDFRRAFHTGIPQRVNATKRAALRIRRVGR